MNLETPGTCKLDAVGQDPLWGELHERFGLSEHGLLSAMRPVEPQDAGPEKVLPSVDNKSATWVNKHRSMLTAPRM